MNRLTELEIINETVEFYSNNPSARAINNLETMCYYKHPDDERECSVGRCFDKASDFYKLRMDTSTSKSIFGLELEIREELKRTDVDLTFEEMCLPGTMYEIDKLFLPQYQGHNLIFWDKLQVLHDTSDYWNKKGLTKEGEEYIKQFKALYETNQEIIHAV